MQAALDRPRRVKPKVLYIGGYFRSGSTLLDRVLGQIDGFVSVGELRYVWDQGFEKNWLCGCGAAFRECPFWREVVERTYGGFDRVDVGEALRLKRSVDRMRHIPRLASPWKSAAFRKNLKRYSGNLGRFYEAIQGASGAEVIVDSSKDASYAYALANVADVDLRLVHLVRDSRAVAYSWLRKKEDYLIKGERSYMDNLSPVGSATGWVRSNLLIEPLKWSVPSKTVRYEDFVRRPGAALSEILELLSEQRSELPLAGDAGVRLGTSHNVSGNPMRFRKGPITLSLDREWKQKMRPSDKHTVTALTLPLLARYGYMSDGA
jgi:hypothetical protein